MADYVKTGEHHEDGSEILQFEGGAKRRRLDEIDFAAIPPNIMRRFAARFGKGTKNYGRFNWRKGLPIEEVINHRDNHMNLWLLGDRSDDHLSAVMWADMCLMDYEDIHPELIEKYLNAISPRKAMTREEKIEAISKPQLHDTDKKLKMRRYYDLKEELADSLADILIYMTDFMSAHNIRITDVRVKDIDNDLEHTMATVKQEQIPWVNDNFFGRQTYFPLIGMCEEVGELYDTVLQLSEHEKMDATTLLNTLRVHAELGKVCHAYLKLQQGIRGDREQHKKAIIQNLKSSINAMYIVNANWFPNIPLSRNLSSVWEQVVKRDWHANAYTGEPQL